MIKAYRRFRGVSTKVNTGWEGGTMHWVEVKLCHKLIWLVCALDTNELPLQHLITARYGKTLSNNSAQVTLARC